MKRSFAPNLSNQEMAAMLFNVASLLKREGNLNPWRTRAYERGARALMWRRASVASVLRDLEEVSFPRRFHVGNRLTAKMREMSRTGDLDQYRAMATQIAPHLADLLRVPGLGPALAERAREKLEVRTASELVAAAGDGRLATVPGFGAKRIAAIRRWAGEGEQPSLFAERAR